MVKMYDGDFYLMLVGYEASPQSFASDECDSMNIEQVILNQQDHHAVVTADSPALKGLSNDVDLPGVGQAYENVMRNAPSFIPACLEGMNEKA